MSATACPRVLMRGRAALSVAVRSGLFVLTYLGQPMQYAPAITFRHPALQARLLRGVQDVPALVLPGHGGADPHDGTCEAHNAALTSAGWHATMHRSWEAFISASHDYDYDSYTLSTVATHTPLPAVHGQGDEAPAPRQLSRVVVSCPDWRKPALPACPERVRRGQYGDPT